MATVKIQGNVSGTGALTIAAPNTNNNVTMNLPDTLGNTGTSAFATTDSSGNLGLGVTPSAWATTNGLKALQIGTGSFTSVSGLNDVNLLSNAYSDATNTLRYLQASTATQYRQVNGQHLWQTAPSGTAGNAISFTQAMTLDASGNWMLGKTTPAASTGGNGAWIAPTGLMALNAPSTVSDTYNYYNSTAGVYRFYVTNAGVINATSTTITAISDQRLKENIQDIDVGLEKIMALKPRRFDWKLGKGKDIKGDRGWIAQEFEQVFPEMITTWKDEPPEGEEPYKAVNADLIPVLVKAIQEQQAIIQTLTARIEALEAK